MTTLSNPRSNSRSDPAPDPSTTPDAERVDAGPPRRGDRPAARTEIAVFLGTVAVLVTGTTAIGLAEGVDVSRIDEAGALGQAAMYGQAAVPGIAALVARRVTRGRSRGAGLGFRRPPLRALGRAWLYAVATVLGAAGLVWATGLAGFASGALGPQVLLGLTVLVVPYLLLALAEDVGWRGLLVTRLAEIAGPRTVVLVGGLAWSAFHWPLMLVLGGAPDGVPIWFGILTFTAGGTLLGAVLASMQLRWGIWPGVLAHAVVNATAYHVVAPLTQERPLTGWFASETGLMAVLAGVVGVVVWWRLHPLVRTPDGRTVAGDRRSDRLG
ncbi:CPBP family intramembrane glutamic endopeptidase [Cellulomonas aerilata]|uniref:CAAX prenyl protease 2/Lysostaphin resistance protein A-like domain-containing protein n=1 Tax=Cellulomonas aerilata TaxID=515326 RepID=A0A512D9P4_9CELL|nr:CPBP family intramembrane glutamic endopeptidase [Cellulomonas aerilata]GEO33145.1 hypothetical protein CAE01nite_08700 [Cellulomonas aerilata]